MDLDARTLQALDWPFVAAALASHARSEAGRFAAGAAALLTDPAAIERCFDEIDELHALLEARAGLPPTAGIDDIRDQLVRAARGESLDLPSVSTVRATLLALSALAEFLARHRAAAPAIARAGEAVRVDARLRRTFDGALDEHGRLSESAWPVLGELRRRIASLERRMHAAIEAVLDSPEYADVLQDRYVSVRGDRLVVPVKAQARGLGLGIVHDASRTERTVFVEPAAVVPIGNERRVAEAALRDEERRILAELTALLAAHATPLAAALEAACAIDVAVARASFALQLGATRPRVGSEAVVDLRAARHPVLVLETGDAVANDLALDATRPVLVLTGPNAGGKTVAMKTIGLACLLVRAGCFVPAAPGSRVDLFGRVLADIGDMQTVHEGLSSFSAHLTTLRAMLAGAGPGTLLLLDEIAAGTDPGQGGALARAVIERLADVGARVVVTTHYAQVKAMNAEDPRVAVAALEYRAGKPTYRVVAGAVGESHALAAAERVGLEPALLDRARDLMESGERALAAALASLEADRARVDAEARANTEARREIEERTRSLAEREAGIRHRARELEKKEAAATVERLRAAEEEVRRVLGILRGAPTQKVAAEARTAIEAARMVAVEAARGPASEPVPLHVGYKVRIPALGTTGEVLALREDEVTVQAGMMTLKVRPGEVEGIPGQQRPPADRAGRGQGATGPRRPEHGAASRARSSEPPETPASVEAPWLEAALRTTRNTVDLRGMRVEEGLEKLDAFLDAAMLAAMDTVFVLHGHGTGAMKSAIRQGLARSPYVREQAPAPADQGGDALTVARLRG